MWFLSIFAFPVNLQILLDAEIEKQSTLLPRLRDFWEKFSGAQKECLEESRWPEG
jgi:hypothetical protein